MLFPEGCGPGFDGSGYQRFVLQLHTETRELLQSQHERFEQKIMQHLEERRASQEEFFWRISSGRENVHGSSCLIAKDSGPPPQEDFSPRDSSQSLQSLQESRPSLQAVLRPEVVHKNSGRFDKEHLRRQSLNCSPHGELNRPSQDSGQRGNLFSSEGRKEGTEIFNSWIRRFVKTQWFEGVCAGLIVGNAALVGIETEYLSSSGEVPTACNTLQICLNVWYVIELLCRFAADGKRFFTSSDELRWNMFDIALVATSIIDLFVAAFTTAGLAMGRMFRGVRMVRILRTIRLSRQLHQHVRVFRKMVFSLISSTQTLFWSMLLLFFLLYSFAVCFTQGAVYEMLDWNDSFSDDAYEDLLKYFGSLGKTLYSLYQAISFGINWGVLVDPLLAADSYFTVALFFIFVGVSIFGALNVVTSIFVDSAMQSTQHYQDLLVHEKIHNVKVYTEHIKKIFRQIDLDNSGDITFSELKNFLANTSLGLKSYFDALEVNASDAWVLFKLLDRDGSGRVDIDEFCDGCIRLKGEARSFDINCMLYENRVMHMHWTEFMQFVEEKFAIIEHVMRAMSLNLCRSKRPSNREVDGQFTVDAFAESRGRNVYKKCRDETTKPCTQQGQASNVAHSPMTDSSDDAPLGRMQATIASLSARSDS